MNELLIISEKRVREKCFKRLISLSLHWAQNTEGIDHACTGIFFIHKQKLKSTRQQRLPRHVQ